MTYIVKNVPFESVDAFTINSVRAQIEGMGYSILSPKDNSKETLTSIVRKLGTIQPYRAGGEDEVFEIRSDADGNEAFLLHSASGTGSLWPHTDAAYLPGDCLPGDDAANCGPPGLVILQCVQPANEGGVTILTDVEEVLALLTADEWENVSAIQSRGGIRFEKGTVRALERMLFRPILNNRWAIRFRLDLMSVPGELFEAAIRVTERLLSTTQAQKMIMLDSGDVLVIDNHRMLHGRSPIISGNRVFRRMWISAASPSLVTGIRSAALDFERLPSSNQLLHVSTEIKALLDHFV